MKPKRRHILLNAPECAALSLAVRLLYRLIPEKCFLNSTKLSEDERREAVGRAVQYAAGRIPVIAQVNFATPHMVIEAAAAARGNGATAVCSAVPRLIPLGEKDLFRYFTQMLESIELPFVIQDFNPGGVTLSSRFLASLNSAFPVRQGGGADDVWPRAGNQ